VEFQSASVRPHNSLLYRKHRPVCTSVHVGKACSWKASSLTQNPLNPLHESLKVPDSHAILVSSLPVTRKILHVHGWATIPALEAMGMWSLSSGKKNLSWTLPSTSRQAYTFPDHPSTDGRHKLTPQIFGDGHVHFNVSAKNMPDNSQHAP
jgi:hypothetical protein